MAKQVILSFEKSTLKRMQEVFLPAEKRKLTGQLEYLLLQPRDDKKLQQIKKRYEERKPTRTSNDSDDKAVKIGDDEFWKGQQEAAKVRMSFRDFAIALMEDWAEEKEAKQPALKAKAKAAAS
jgi:hypothetical protein